MVTALFDTNILIDFLSASPEARSELALYEKRKISLITWIEVLVGVDAAAEAVTRRFLEGFDVVHPSFEIAGFAVDLRRLRRIKLPDALIWATAKANNLTLVTRNTKDFGPNEPGIRVPYTLEP